jgi:hypothetical protein
LNFFSLYKIFPKLRIVWKNDKEKLKIPKYRSFV